MTSLYQMQPLMLLRNRRHLALALLPGALPYATKWTSGKGTPCSRDQCLFAVGSLIRMTSGTIQLNWVRGTAFGTSFVNQSV